MTEPDQNLPERLCQTVLNSMEHGYVFMDTDGVIRAFNEAACRILGRTVEELTGNTSADPDWGSIREDGTEFPARQHPAMVSLKSGKACFGVIMGVRLGGDRLRWLSINSDVVRDPETRETVGAVATFADITPHINQKKYFQQAFEDLQSSNRATNENAGYLKSTLLSLAAEIVEADRRLIALIDPAADAAREQAELVALKAEKIARLLTQERNG